MSDLQQWFDNEWWPILIKKEDKQDAWKAVSSLKPNLALREKIIRAQINYNQYVTDKQVTREFIKLPAGWIRKRRWENPPYVSDETPRIKEIVYCPCGKIAKVGEQCLECFTKLNEVYTPGLGTGIPSKVHYNHLKTLGLGKHKDETLPDYIARLQVYCKSSKYGQVVK